MSPDWSAKEEPVPYAKLDDPQSLNLYGYVLNNPLKTVDKDGHCAEVVSCTLEFAAGGSTIGPVGTVVGGVIGAGVGLAVTYFVGKEIANHIHQSENASPASTEQGRDEKGRFLPKQPGQTQPGAQPEKETLAAEGATKTGTALPGTDRRVDGTVTDTGQKIEVKSGQQVSNTGQLIETGDAARAATGQPLLVVTTHPNVQITGPAKGNPNLEIRPAKQQQ